MRVLHGKFTSLFKVTQVRDIPFLPPDIVISKGYPELWLPSGDHKEPLLQKTEGWHEADFGTFIGCPTSRLAIIGENKRLYHLSHSNFIYLFYFIFGCVGSSLLHVGFL